MRVHFLLLLSLCLWGGRLAAFSQGAVVGYDSLRSEGLVVDSLRLTSREEENPALQSSSLEASVLRTSSFSRTSWRRFCDSLSMPWLVVSSLVLPGAGQVINADYWKLPLVWGGIGGATFGSVYFHRRWTSLRAEPLVTDPSERLLQESRLTEMYYLRNSCIVAAAVSYSLSVADALISHERGYISPTAALFSSALLPGLGQLYTQMYWKIPIIYGAGVFLVSQFMRMDQLYRRFDKALTYLVDERPETIDEFEGKRSRQDIEYFRDYYRRNRDLSLLGISLLYFLNVVDAYVGAHLYYWNVDSNLAMRLYPSFEPRCNGQSGVLALNLNLSF